MRAMDQKDVLTTGEVAKICHVAPRTVSKWFDAGKLRGYRIPGSRDRRIPRQQLMAFMRAHGMPLDGLDGGVCRVLIVDQATPARLIERINDSSHYEVRTADNGFEAGILAEQFHPHVIVLSAADNAEEASAICANIKANAALQGTKVVAAVTDPIGRRSGELLGRGFDECVSKPYSAEQLLEAVEKATNLINL